MTRTTQERRRARPTSHYEQAKRAVEDLATELVEAGENRLPAEDRLAEETGFSRPTIRSALLALQMEGKVLRLHGVGTFVNRHALGIEANLAEDIPFLEVIERLGYEASLDIVNLTEEPLPPHVLSRLGRTMPAMGVVIDRLFRASGEPAVVSRDYIPVDHLATPTRDLTAEGSTFAFLHRWTGHSVRYSVAQIRSLVPPEGVANILAVTDGKPVLLLDHLHIDERDEAVGVTEAYVRDDLIDFAVVRTGSDM